MEILNKILWYIRPGKKDGDRANLNLRFMHGMNKISILIFLGVLTFLLIRWLIRHF